MGASVKRLRDRVTDAIAAWRRSRHDARYLGYLNDIELGEIGLTRSTLRNMGIHAPARRCRDQERFPF